MSSRAKKLMTIGMLSLIAAMLMVRFAPETDLYDFVKGMFFGLSIGANLMSLVFARRDRVEEGPKH